MNLFVVNESCWSPPDSLFCASSCSNSISSLVSWLYAQVEFESPWWTTRVVTVPGGAFDDSVDAGGEWLKLFSIVSWEFGLASVWNAIFTLRLFGVGLNKIILSSRLVCSDAVGALTCQDRLGLYSDAMFPWVWEVSLGVLLGVWVETEVSVCGDPWPRVVTDDSLLSSGVGLILALNSSLISLFHWYQCGSCGGVFRIEFGLK